MLKITNPNYAAKICVIEHIHKHPNADKLQLVTIDNEVAIVDMSYKQGDVVVKFPLECSINKHFIAACNMFSDNTMNLDIEAKGFFNKHGRVRAIKLRDVFCGCYVHNIDSFNSYFKTDFTAADAGSEFTDIGDVMVCEKYVPIVRNTGQSLGTKRETIKNIDLILDNQFRFHWDTTHFGRNEHKVISDDIISITYKIHGTSGQLGHILLKKKPNLLSKIAKLLGVAIKESEYGFVAASRKVIKTVEAETVSKPIHFYGHDIWTLAADTLKDYVPQGISLYYELVGYTPSGGYIQKDYDYGFKPGTENSWVEGVNYGIYVYRITYTTPQGTVIEYDWGSIKAFCLERGIKHVPEIYYGKADDYLKDSEKDLKIIDKLMAEIEKQCYICTNKVPMEGYVLRRETRNTEAFKIKSKAFCLAESKNLDSEEINIEDSNS